MQRVPTIIFDMDGVLIDSEEAWDDARRRLVAETGGTWKDEATRAMMGMSAPEWSAYVRDELHVPLEASEIDRRVVALLLAVYDEHLPLLPGACDAVRRAAERSDGGKLGLASSSNRPVIDLVLEGAGIAELFTATVSSEEVARGKPSPDVYLECAERLGVDPAACLAVEDSTNGIKAAHAAGMRVIALPNAAFPPDEDALALAEQVLDGADALFR